MLLKEFWPTFVLNIECVFKLKLTFSGSCFLFCFPFICFLFVSNGFKFQRRLFLKAFRFAILFCFLFLRSEMIIFSLDKPLKKINLSNSPVHLPTASLCSVLFIKDPRFGLITVEGQKDWRSGQVHCETV